MAQLDDPVDVLGLPPRLQHMFRRENISVIGDLTALHKWDLLSLPNFGVGSLDLVTARLAEHGLSLREYSR